ncbi:MAG TPA: hypothetical protein VFN87_01860 [Solirubrobacteraceae bacterium]|nr:hypothetical protein [Solirubrobacteraceae bacterium]
MVAGALLAETVPLWLRGYRLGGRVVVRCRHGHLFSTLWIPAVSIKALRLGPWRVQRCPVGRHWTVVTPVRRSELSDEQLRAADAIRDTALP